MGKKSMEVDTNGAVEETEETGEKRLSYKEQCLHVNVIAKPLAPRKLAKKIYQLIGKANNVKGNLRHGLKDVQCGLRKNETGVVIIAGDVTPHDIYSHLPGLLEERKIPYIYTPSREDLGLAMSVKRSVLVLLIKENEDYKPAFDEVVEKIKQQHSVIEYP